ncbi:MAG: alanine--tRNA ligase [Candidatus Aminicenantaceae bacterium]
MLSQEIRETFLNFFSNKKHKIIKSSSLLPKDDPTILFTNAGMNQFKNYFLGLEKRSYKRAASVQKCLRVSGKHNDLEQVGKTNKHHTFFEMLGNFSFGDYFKEKAIEFAWELITETYKLQKDKIYITIYKEDEEAFKIWKNNIGIPDNRIFRLGRKDNYWSMGDVGPCGPCSELHYDIREKIEKGDPLELIKSGSDQFIELWNLVFMQYYQDDKQQLHDLPAPSIDTGMGLERMASALQGKKSSYETDLFSPVIEIICEYSNREYPNYDGKDVSVRIIADHVRSICFLISDGVMPENEGRGYVLRRLIRRAYRHGNFLDINEPFLYKLISPVVDVMKDAYPELLSSVDYISKLCQSEERRFSKTLSSGMRTFSQYIEEAKKNNDIILSGEQVFKLYDTFGFPLDLSKELLLEEGIGVDEDGFYKELEKQRQRARKAWTGDDQLKEREVYENFKDLFCQFIGYEKVKVSNAKVIGMVKGNKKVEELNKGEEGEIFLNKTPFYAEAGGQIGDSGVMKNPLFSAIVKNTYYPIPELISHEIKVISGKIKTGDKINASVDMLRRKAISRNHTVTHLLHASLRKILGDHIKQAGSLVSPYRLRFDYTHFTTLDDTELRQVESLVNEKIRDNIPVKTTITTIEEGMREGAIAIFEEKYGETVRMVTIGDFSKELCGGIHVKSTGEIGLFKIVSESSIAAGMRRIEALTGEYALKCIQDNEEILNEIQYLVSASREDIKSKVIKIKDQVKDDEKEIKRLKQKLSNIKYKANDQSIKKVKGLPVLVQKVEGLNHSEFRELSDTLKQKIHSGIVVLGGIIDGKVFITAGVTKDLTNKFDAQNFIKEITPIIEGGGGGRSDFAQAGGTKTENLDKALNDSYSIIEKLIV